MFVDHVRCLHNQIQTVKKCVQLKKFFIEIYDSESEQWSYKRTLMLFINSQVVTTLDHTGIHNYAFYLTSLSS